MTFLKSIGIILLFYSLLTCTSKSTEPENASAEPQQPQSAPLTLKLEKAWETDTLLRTAESVLFDSTDGLYYVSCIGKTPPNNQDQDGYISKIDQRGNIIKLKWITGLSAPKGMGLVGRNLYVTDINRVVIIDLKEGRKIKSIPFHNSKFLNDIAVSKDGKVYVSDSDDHSIYTFDGDIPLLLHQDTAMGGPNGLWAEAGGLMCASFGSGEVFKYNFADQSRKILNSSIPGGDGILPYIHGYLVSNWNGEVFFLDSLSQQHLLLDTKGSMNAADIEVVANQNLLVVPTFFANKVVAYNIKNE